MLNIFLIIVGKSFSKISKLLNLGSGSTWPGHIALETNKNFIKNLIRKNPQLIIVIVAGTNGKTTTGKLIQTILEANGNRVFQNKAGANLLNGISSALLLHSNVLSTKINYDYAIFEVDENSLSLVLNEFEPNYIIFLNLFRDQLDRYGEVDSIAKKWKSSLEKVSKKTTLILNADDPQIAFLGENYPSKTIFFGINNSVIDTATHHDTADSTYCPNCNSKLKFNAIYFSHLGDWQCPKCKLKRPKLNIDKWEMYPLPGTYNKYNILASVLFARINGINDKIIDSALQKFTPAFGRQEEIEINGKYIKIFLSKNPTSLNESLRTIVEESRSHLASQGDTLKEKVNLLCVLNDRIPDGRDVSWIWDTNLESFIDEIDCITVSGDRAYDMALRLKYANSSKFQIEENLQKAIELGLKTIDNEQTLYILPTYSAMLEVRKILTGKKIL